MSARREPILARMFEILKTIEDIKSTWRNRTALQNDARPALYLLDGDELNPNPDQGTNRGRGSSAGFPYLLHMTPQVHLALDDRTGEHNVSVGPDLNMYLGRIQFQISTDKELKELVTTSGDILYMGLQSDLGVGRTMAGQYQINWRLQYPAVMDQLSID